MHVQSECQVDSRSRLLLCRHCYWRRGARVQRMASRNIHGDDKHGDNKMTDRWLRGVVIVALMVVGTVAVQAADLPTRKEAPAPVFVPPPFTWTGFYVGVNAGGIWSSGSRDASIFDPDAAFDGGFLTSAFPGSLEDRAAPASSGAARPATIGRLEPW